MNVSRRPPVAFLCSVLGALHPTAAVEAAPASPSGCMGPPKPAERETRAICPVPSVRVDREETKRLPPTDHVDPRLRALRSGRAAGFFPLVPERTPGRSDAFTDIGGSAPAVLNVADSDLVADVIATDYQPYFVSAATGISAPTGIYTEFGLCVDGVIWNGRPSSSLGPGSRIEVFRLGGAIRDADGKTYRVTYMGPFRPLLPGRRFLVYLRWDEESQTYFLIGGYELARSGKATNLNSRAALPSRSVSEVLRDARDEAAAASHR